MILFLYGPETFLLHRRVKEIQESRTLPKGVFHLRVFNQENFNIEEFLQELESPSLFKEKKLILLENLFDYTDSLLEYKDSFTKKQEHILMFVQEGDVKKANQLFLFLKKHADVEEFLLLNDIELKKWIKAEFAKYQATASLKAVDELVLRVRNDLWRLSKEIQKLVCFKKAAVIEKEDVELLVRANVEVDVFSTLNAIGSKDKSLALELLSKHKEKGDTAPYMISMFAFQLRSLLSIKELADNGMLPATIAQKSKLHPFVVRKGLEVVGKFSLAELKRLYRKLFALDLATKTGRVNPSQALFLFVEQI